MNQHFYKICPVYSIQKEISARNLNVFRQGDVQDERLWFWIFSWKIKIVQKELRFDSYRGTLVVFITTKLLFDKIKKSLNQILRGGLIINKIQNYFCYIVICYFILLKVILTSHGYYDYKSLISYMSEQWGWAFDCLRTKHWFSFEIREAEQERTGLCLRIKEEYCFKLTLFVIVLA